MKEDSLKYIKYSLMIALAHIEKGNSMEAKTSILELLDYIEEMNSATEEKQ